MFILILSIISFIGKSTAIFSPVVKNDVGLHVVDMIKNHGYPAEKYHLTTPDGYILEIHRIPYGLSSNNSKPKRRILLMHGILGTSANFVAMGPERALAYILADLNYDVWIGNSRGNLYARKHAYLDPDIDKRKFFDFSFHEIGYYDLPTIIDFILQITGVDDLYYACLSQGCTTFAVLMTTRPAYNSKIRLASLMGPVVIMTHTRSQIVNELALIISLYSSMAFYDTLGVYETPFTRQLQKLAVKYCGMPIFETICSQLIALVVGGSGRLTYKGIIPVAASNDLVGVSMKQFYHYAQILILNRFAQFDYGIIKNLLVYGKIAPPAYNLSLITAPTAVYYSEGDTVADIRDARTLIKILPNVIFSYQVPSNEFSHTDFVLSKYAVELVYNKLIETMK